MLARLGTWKIMNELELQRLVDGEGNDQWRASLLTSLGEDASQWRELAMRLLEDQRLKKHFRSAERSAPVVTVAKETSQRTSKRDWSMGAFAASLLFLMVGSSAYYKSLHPSSEATSSVGATGGESLASIDAQKKTGLPDSIFGQESIQADIFPVDAAPPSPVPAGRVQWLASSGSDEVLETPVYAVSQVAPEMLLGEQAKRLLRANSQLNRQGWNANFDTKIFEGQMEDGRRMIVPVNVVRVEPLGY